MKRYLFPATALLFVLSILLGLFMFNVISKEKAETCAERGGYYIGKLDVCVRKESIIPMKPKAQPVSMT